MATPEGGKPIDSGLMARAVASLNRASAKMVDWFGPNDPLPPSAPDEVKGRPWDFPVGINLSYQPRKDQSADVIDFITLRRIADPVQGGLDLLRIAIETRKDQMEAQKWCIKGRDGSDGGDKAKKVMQALSRPDMVRTYRQWARPYWDDLLTIDAPAMYFRPMPGGLAIPQVIDGATIKILVDHNGATPLPPNPAYQQIIKGLPAVDYTLDELHYSPRNLRSFRYYGMSPVEQVLGIANIGLKRQLHLLSYYTDGNTPDAILLPPEGWNPDQIKQAQKNLDTMVDSAKRRKINILPGGHYEQLKDPKLKDELDDWLARIICYCFSLAPGALVKDMTKATGDTNKETAAMEGLEPLKLWWKDVMDAVLEKCYLAPELEFAYEDEEIPDPKTKMEVWTGWKNAGIVTVDEVRDKALGLDPLTDAQKEELAPPPPIVVGPGSSDGSPVGKPGSTQGKVGESASPLSPAPAKKSAPGEGLKKNRRAKVLTHPKRDRPVTKKAIKAIQKLFLARFKHQRSVLVAAVRANAQKLFKMTNDEFMDLWSELSDENREKLRQALVSELTKVATDTAQQTLVQTIEFSGANPKTALDEMLSQANAQAIAWAEDRAAELVGMKWSEDAQAWIENPNPAWSIDGTTRDSINRLVGEAEEKGWSNDELADAIQEETGFSDERAEMVARTETAFADVQGNLIGWKESGVVEAKEWSVSQDEVCEDCLALQGVIVPLDESFDLGGEPVDGPPAHPNCRCDVLPVVISQEEIDALTQE
jgi:SPP1 gp7 family putative phage head morphogenesis protein